MVATVGLIVSTVCVSSCSGEALLIYYALSTIRLSVPVYARTRKLHGAAAYRLSAAHWLPAAGWPLELCGLRIRPQGQNLVLRLSLELIVTVRVVRVRRWFGFTVRVMVSARSDLHEYQAVSLFCSSAHRPPQAHSVSSPERDRKKSFGQIIYNPQQPRQLDGNVICHLSLRGKYHSGYLPSVWGLELQGKGFRYPISQNSTCFGLAA